MERDEKIDLLAGHLTVTHQDNVRIQKSLDVAVSELEDLSEDVREAKQEMYTVSQNLVSFEAEARLLINDRIGEMSVERLAEVIPRQKVDQIRALQFAREKGAAVESPLARDPTGSQPTHAIDAEDSGKTAASSARGAWRDFLRAPSRGQLAGLALAFIVMMALALAVFGYYQVKNFEIQQEGAPIKSKERRE